MEGICCHCGVRTAGGGLHGVFAVAAEAACCGVAGAMGAAGATFAVVDVQGLDSIWVTFTDVIACTSVLSSTYNLYKVQATVSFTDNLSREPEARHC